MVDLPIRGLLNMSRLVSERKISNDVAVPITGYIYDMSLSFAIGP